MAKKWLYGTFKDGATSLSNELPYIWKSDKIRLNINNEDQANIRVAKADLPNPAQWQEFLKPVYTMLVAVDDSKAWNDEGAVLFAGYIKEAVLSDGVIQVQVVGMREYASNIQPKTVFTGAVGDPDAGKEWQGSTYQHLITSVAQEVWNDYGKSSSSNPTPPSTQGSSTVTPDTGSMKYKAIVSQFMSVSDILDDLRDNVSNAGNEYRYVPRWKNSSRNAIVWDVVVGSNSAPQINLSNVLSVNIDNPDSYRTKVTKGLSATDYATRISGISKQGDDETPSDLTISAVSEGGTLLMDTVFNPGVELTSAELSSHMSARLAFQKQLQQDGEIGVVLDAGIEWITKIGSKVQISSSGDNPFTSGVTFESRLVEVSFSLSTTDITTTIMALAPKYGKLPKSRTKDPKNPAGTKLPNSGAIVPKQPANKPIGGGGGGTPTPTPVPPSDLGDDVPPTPVRVVRISSGWSSYDTARMAQAVHQGGKAIYQMSGQTSPSFAVGTGGLIGTEVAIYYNEGMALQGDWPKIDIHARKVTWAASNVSQTALPSITIDAAWLSARSALNTGKLPSPLPEFVTGTINLGVFVPTSSVPSQIRYKSLAAYMWAGETKLFIHFVETYAYGSTGWMQYAGEYVHSFTASFDINPSDGSLSNLKDEPRFGEGSGLPVIDNYAWIPNFGVCSYEGNDRFNFSSVASAFGMRWWYNSGGYIHPLQGSTPLALGANAFRSGGRNASSDDISGMSYRGVLSPVANDFRYSRWVITPLAIGYDGASSEPITGPNIENYAKILRKNILTSPAAGNRPGSIMLSSVNAKEIVVGKGDVYIDARAEKCLGGWLVLTNSEIFQSGIDSDGYATYESKIPASVAINKGDVYGFSSVSTDKLDYKLQAPIFKISDTQVYYYKQSVGLKRVTIGRQEVDAPEVTGASRIDEYNMTGQRYGRNFANIADGYWIGVDRNFLFAIMPT